MEENTTVKTEAYDFIFLTPEQIEALTPEEQENYHFWEDWAWGKCH